MTTELAKFVRVSRYARWRADKHRRETWKEQIARVMKMHREFYCSVMTPELESWFLDIEEYMNQMKILGSQRVLQFGGPAVLNKHARLYNCTATHIDRPRVFQEVVWLLLCGCGVGCSVQQHHIDKLPSIQPVNPKDLKTFVIEDSIEGWADSFGVLLYSYFGLGEYAGKNVVFDYSKIRPNGSPISHMDGKAPGPEPLRKALENIRALMNRITATNQTRMKSIDAFDIITHSSDAVIAGGVRRSALITMFSLTDQDMMKAKTGDWFITNPQRARSNNSVMLKRGQVSEDEFMKIIHCTKQFGEPGFIWTDDLEALYNPCGEIRLHARDAQGQSGCEFCNLTEINMRVVESPEEFYTACRLASALGTLQAGYTRFPYLGPITEDIVRTEALIGVSMTGMMDTPHIAFDPVVQKQGAEIVVDTNKLIAKLIGINKAARCTTVKPAGSTSCILSSASGIHPHHSKRFFRRVQANKNETTLKFYKSINPKAVEESLWSANKTDDVVTFLCEAKEGALTKKQVGAMELLKYVRLTQQNWIRFGSEGEHKHNVSNTVTVEPDEWEQVGKYIFDHSEDFAGVSLLSNSGDRDFVQAPFQNVFTPEELVSEYGSAAMFASGLIVHALEAFKGNLYRACDTYLGIGEKLDDLPVFNRSNIPESIDAFKILAEKLFWIQRAEKFTKNYFAKDPNHVTAEEKKRMTYCLKDVDAYKTWCDIARSSKPVDWEYFFEDQDDTNPSADAACAGGVCTLVRL